MNSLSQILWFLAIQWIGLAMADIAEWAASGADFTHDHKGGGTVTKALMQVGASGFFADGSHFVVAQNIFDLLNLGRGG